MGSIIYNLNINNFWGGNGCNDITIDRVTQTIDVDGFNKTIYRLNNGFKIGVEVYYEE